MATNKTTATVLVHAFLNDAQITVDPIERSTAIVTLFKLDLVNKDTVDSLKLIPASKVAEAIAKNDAKAVKTELKGALKDSNNGIDSYISELRYEKKSNRSLVSTINSALSLLTAGEKQASKVINTLYTKYCSTYGSEDSKTKVRKLVAQNIEQVLSGRFSDNSYDVQLSEKTIETLNQLLAIVK
jgi:hypothetical protein